MSQFLLQVHCSSLMASKSNCKVLLFHLLNTNWLWLQWWPLRVLKPTHSICCSPVHAFSHLWQSFGEMFATNCLCNFAKKWNCPATNNTSTDCIGHSMFCLLVQCFVNDKSWECHLSPHNKNNSCMARHCFCAVNVGRQSFCPVTAIAVAICAWPISKSFPASENQWHCKNPKTISLIHTVETCPLTHIAILFGNLLVANDFFSLHARLANKTYLLFIIKARACFARAQPEQGSKASILSDFLIIWALLHNPFYICLPCYTKNTPTTKIVLIGTNPWPSVGRE